MKYGKTERISGIVILLALLAIFVPWLMSDPAPREERPQPTFVIEQPGSVTRQEVPVPQRPASIEEDAPAPSRDTAVASGIQALPVSPDTDRVEAASPSASEAPATPDPIADLVASNEATSNTASSSGSDQSDASSTRAPATAEQGEWAVQVGSFGDVANAQRLSEQLASQGFTAFRRARDNNLTSVYVGPYATSEEGESAMALIKQRANVQGLLVRVRD